MTMQDAPPDWDGGLHIERHADHTQVVLADVDIDPASDFEGFRRAQFKAFHAWLLGLPGQLPGADLEQASGEGFVAFASALASAAERHGHERGVEADLYAEFASALVAFCLAAERVGEPDLVRIGGEIGAIQREGLKTEKEMQAETEMQQSMANRVRSNSRLGHDVAVRIGVPRYRLNRVAEARTLAFHARPRTPRPRRRRCRPAARGRAPTRGDPPLGDDSDPEHHRLSQEVAR